MVKVVVVVIIVEHGIVAAAGAGTFVSGVVLVVDAALSEVCFFY